MTFEKLQSAHFFLVKKVICSHETKEPDDGTFKESKKFDLIADGSEIKYVPLEMKQNLLNKRNLQVTL